MIKTMPIPTKLSIVSEEETKNLDDREKISSISAAINKIALPGAVAEALLNIVHTFGTGASYIKVDNDECWLNAFFRYDRGSDMANRVFDKFNEWLKKYDPQMKLVSCSVFATQILLRVKTKKHSVVPA